MATLGGKANVNIARADIEAKGTGADVRLLADSELRTNSLAAGAAAFGTASVGGAIDILNVEQGASSLLGNGSTVKAGGDFNMLAGHGSFSEQLAFGGAASRSGPNGGGVAAAANLTIANYGGNSIAEQNGEVTAGGSARIAARNALTQRGLGAAIALSGGTAIGASVGVANSNRETKAGLKGSVTAGGDIVTDARSSVDLGSMILGVAGSKSGPAIAGSAIYQSTDDRAEASIADNAIARAGGSVGVIADEDADFAALAATPAVSTQSVAIGGGLQVLNHDSDVLALVGNGAEIMAGGAGSGIFAPGEAKADATSSDPLRAAMNEAAAAKDSDVNTAKSGDSSKSKTDEEKEKEQAEAVNKAVAERAAAVSDKAKKAGFAATSIDAVSGLLRDDKGRTDQNAGKGLVVSATSVQGVTSVSLNGAGGKSAGLTGGAISYDSDGETRAEVGAAKISGNNNAGGVIVLADDNRENFAIAGAAAYGGNAGVGASVLHQNVNRNASALVLDGAEISGNWNGNFATKATSTAKATRIGIAGAYGGTAGLGGNASVYNDNATAKAVFGAKMTDYARAREFGVEANRSTDILNISGGLGLGAVGVGAAVSTLSLSGGAEARVTDNAAITADTTTTVKADVDHDIDSFTIAGAIAGTVAVAGSTSVLTLDDHAHADAGGTLKLNNAFINARNHVDSFGITGGLAAGKGVSGAAGSFAFVNDKGFANAMIRDGADVTTANTLTLNAVNDREHDGYVINLGAGSVAGAGASVNLLVVGPDSDTAEALKRASEAQYGKGSTASDLQQKIADATKRPDAMDKGASAAISGDATRIPLPQRWQRKTGERPQRARQISRPARMVMPSVPAPGSVQRRSRPTPIIPPSRQNSL